MKPVSFLGDSLEVLRRFPSSARQRVGYQIDRVQRGLDPADWKPVLAVGAGVREIRVRDDSGAYRVFFVATLADAIHVLHCFQKKSARTSRSDLDIAARRYKELMRGRR
jgi:phage-related protein